jgi:hypothetical protein
MLDILRYLNNVYSNYVKYVEYYNVKNQFTSTEILLTLSNVRARKCVEILLMVNLFYRRKKSVDIVVVIISGNDSVKYFGV